MKLVERVQKAREYEQQMYGELRDHPINLDEIFDAVVNTVHFQYAGFDHNRQYYTPNEYHTYVFTHYRYRSLTYEMLVRSLQQFIGDMHDRHLRLLCDDWIDYKKTFAPFHVRAAQDVLYVTDTAPDTGLSKGDMILEIQGLTPEKVRRLTRRNSFYSREPEREIWDDYLGMASSYKVRRSDGTEETVKISPVSPSCKPAEPAMLLLTDETVYLRIEHMDREDLSSFLTFHQSEIAECQKLIIDLRNTDGGDTGAGWELFPLMIKSRKQLGDLIADEGSYVKCTDENCRIRISQLSACKETLDAGEDQQEALQILEEELAFYRENMGKGLVYRPAEVFGDEEIVPAPDAPEKIIILTDTRCENEGEEFVSMARRCSDKVILLGRPTMGTLDYFDNIDLQVHDHMILSYPIRMTKAAFEGRGISGKGICPDICIPWTPEEITEDLLLKKALEL